MGASVVGTTLLGQDILVRLAEAATNNSGSGFTRPLGAGVYSMYIQETGGIPSNYTLTFNITAVPEPSAMLLLGCVATVALPIIWNRKRRGR